MSEFEEKILNEILPLVSKPGRYIGNEVNVIRKDWSKCEVKFALIFPDLYEIGMSHIGFEILYHILNKEDSIVAERVYAPAADIEELLRNKQLSLFSLESKKPLTDFDILGFTLQYELHYTNILNILNLSNIPIHSKDRENQFPLIIAGGPCAFNPEPLANFIDAFVIGDGEDAIIEISNLVGKLKKQGITKDEILRHLSRLPGVYVPKNYDVRYDNQIQILTKNKEDIPETVKARILDVLKNDYYPVKPLVPLMETTHNRYSVEIMRGCTQGCRFCNAGYIYRPTRERDAADIVKQVKAVIKNTGYDEVSLASLSTSDYSQLYSLLIQLTHKLERDNVKISFPSLRTESFTSEMAHYANRIKQTGLTLAPEAGTERLRNIINKTNTNDDLMKAVNIALEAGWRKIKLYFMIGQPEETQEDLDGIVHLINEILRLSKPYKGTSFNVSISPFSPKAHTPFQWAKQDSIEEMERKVYYLRNRLQNPRLKFNWREPEVAHIESVIARGDRRVGDVIYNAWKLGAKFDAWSDQFHYDLWLKSFETCQVEPSWYTREFDIAEVLPWDHISKGVTKDFLIREWKRALSGRTINDCKTDVCNVCGLMEHPNCKERIESIKAGAEKGQHNPVNDTADSNFGRAPRKVKPVFPPVAQAVRLKYEKMDNIRFTSHLDLIRIFERAFRRAGVNLVYTQGFHPHPKIAYGPPLTMGFTSNAEYMDLHYYQQSGMDLISALNSVLPQGLQILELKNIFGKVESLASIINRAEYSVILNKNFDQSYLNESIENFLNRTEIPIERQKGTESQLLDIRPFIDSIRINDSNKLIHFSFSINDGKTVRISEVLKELFGLSDNDIALCRINRDNFFIQVGEEKFTPLQVA